MPLILNGDGSVGPLSSTEVGYLDGVTSAVQTQINSKASSSNPTISGTVSGLREWSSGHTYNLEFYKGSVPMNGTAQPLFSFTVSDSYPSFFYAGKVSMFVGDTYTGLYQEWNVGGRIYSEGSTVFDSLLSPAKSTEMLHGSKQSSFWQQGTGTLTNSINSRTTTTPATVTFSYTATNTGNVFVGGVWLRAQLTTPRFAYGSGTQPFTSWTTL